MAWERFTKVLEKIGTYFWKPDTTRGQRKLKFFKGDPPSWVAQNQEALFVKFHPETPKVYFPLHVLGGLYSLVSGLTQRLS